MNPTRTADERQAQTEAAEPLSAERVLADYTVAVESREASLIGRRDVLTGKGKFGIFGDGKEVPQLAMARAFRPGDFRSGYYRDQTFMMAIGELTLEQFFAQIYADADPRREPSSGGRQMNAHFATALVGPDGEWLDQTRRRNSSADLSPTGSQMPRLVGLAHASRLYRELPELAAGSERFSNGGSEIAFGTIGDASCAEGMFWEAVNAAGVLGAPMLLSIWDDGYGISVPGELQITKGHLSHVLSGFQLTAEDPQGYEIRTVPGWDYPRLVETYLEVTAAIRERHVPYILHVTELTQPQGHSTSGSHERYKSEKRLEWEREHDCVRRMRAWILESGRATEEELDTLEGEAWERVREAQRNAWKAFREPLDAERGVVLDLLAGLSGSSAGGECVEDVRRRLERQPGPVRRDLHSAALEALVVTRDEASDARRRLADWLDSERPRVQAIYSSHLLNEGAGSPLEVEAVPPVYPAEPEELRGFEVLNRCFDAALERHPQMIAFGEDLGALGDVNQGFAGLQEKYGALRVADTGIRETTIMGQAIGLALRGLRPVAEIQYLDYVLYALQILSDDLATLRWRTRGRQKAPVIVRTRGHRLEGVWHSGSPMAALIHLLRGLHLCVPRDMTRAAGFYNTLLEGDDPALVVEVLNGYRRKEPVPENLTEIRLPLGRPEVLRAGSDVTVVTYGACCRIAEEASELLAEAGVDVELVDVQTLLPFDLDGRIVESLRKTGRVLFLDEDVPGGTTAYMMRQVLEEQGGWYCLDGPPRTLSSRPHRPAYGSDGDYFSKPSREDVFRAVWELMHEGDPGSYPIFY